MQSLLEKDGFPSAEEVRELNKPNDIHCYSTWLKRAKKHIIMAGKTNKTYCYFHLKYYFIDKFDHVYASIVDKEIKILNPINDNVLEDAEMLMMILEKLGYKVTPFVGEAPFGMNRCNMSTQEFNEDEVSDVFVGHGALGLYVRW